MSKLRRISILGSTGTIGKCALDVIDNLKNYKVYALSTNKNIDLLVKQIIKYAPKEVVITDKSSFEKFCSEFQSVIKKHKIAVHFGVDGLKQIASLKGVNIVLFSIVGAIGLLPILSAIKAGKDVAIANKEPLVIAGDIIMKEALKYKVNVLPIDSEHSAIFQCLMGEDVRDVRRILITASGGPFYEKSKKELKNVTIKDTLKHPRWKMGPKITVDSATLMNKGLELIEAYHLFGVNKKQIQIVIHPESIVHSMVEFIDGSIKAQLGPTDMRAAIQFALTYPKRQLTNINYLDFTKVNSLHFETPNILKFSCLKMAIDALHKGGSIPVVLNAANEIAVEKFLNKEIRFIDIEKLIFRVLNIHKSSKIKTLNDVLSIDTWARDVTREVII